MASEIQSIGDILEILKRRKFYLLIPFLVIFTISIITAFLIPAIYKASTTIMIQEQLIPSEFVRSTVQTVVEETLETISYQVLSRKKLLEIIERFDLYKDLLARKTTEEVINKMRKDIKRKTISAQINDKRTGRESTATVAFTLSYEGKNPGKVQKVTNTLSSLYMEENLRDREKRAKSTTDFMAAELKIINTNINELEIKIAAFKKKHLTSLPEMNHLNYQMYERIEREIDNIDQQVCNTKERKIFLQAQLSAIDPEMFISDARQRLENYKNSYLVLKASLSEQHPDIIKLKKEIKAIKQEQNIKENLSLKQDKLKSLRDDLSEQQKHFSDQRPEIKKLKKTISVLENEIQGESDKIISLQTDEESPDNPAYVSMNTQIETAAMEIESLKKKKKQLQAKLEDYQKRLEVSPQVELEYKLLTRDYENARQRYTDTLYKQMLAHSAETMEKTQKGQRFTIIDAAILPEKPFKPNRMAIVFIGFIMATGLGAGLTCLKEVTDQSIRSDKSLAILTKLPVLAVVSVIETKQDRKQKRKAQILFFFSSITVFGISILSVHIFYMPLSVIWFKILRKLVSIGLISP